MTISLAQRSRRFAVRVMRHERSRVAVADAAVADAGVAATHACDPSRAHGTPLLAPDVDRAITRLLALRRELPDVQIHVATASLPHPAVIRAVDAFGASFAVASRGDIDLLEREGVAIGRCLHTRPVKTVADITGSYLRGIRTFVIDRADEVAKFQELPGVAVLVRLSFPAPGPSAHLTSTSGVAPHDAGALLGHCLRAGLRVAGFTFDVGPAASAATWGRTVRRTLATMRRLERAHGIRFDMLDLGGGLPVADDESPSGLAGRARGIRAAIADAPSRYRILIRA
jgi:ornithine decarboxylase